MVWDKPKFNLEKTCQMTAFFLTLAGGRLDIYTLVKLLYILDREGYKRWGHAVTFDDYVSMPHGPVVSKTYNLLKGETTDSLWEEHFSKHEADYYISLVKKSPDFGLLSRAEEELARELYNEYGELGFNRLWEITHDFVEYNDPGGSSSSIEIESLLRAVTDDEQEIEAVREELQAQAFHERFFGQYV